MRTIIPFSHPLHMAPATDPHAQLTPPVDPHLPHSTPPQQVATPPSASHPPPPPPDASGSHVVTFDYPPPTMQTVMASNMAVAPGHPGHSWNEGAVPGPSTQPPPQRTSSKRKLDASDGEDPHAKIRRVVRDHLARDSGHVMPMTTVICLHAAVAQKSYGSEKRFLCPPPVVHIEGPVWNMKQQQLAMSVVSEAGERSFEQKAPLDHNLTASFKFLHVTGSAKAKNFQLSLDLAEPSLSGAEGGDSASSGRVWASFDSAPVTIISKPSKKTAKTRNLSSCILAGGPVSLFNRINSQTVRTKYMTVENGQLCASNVAWSSFHVNVVQPSPNEVPPMGPQPVTYGSEIILTDTVVGTRTGPLIIRKVDKGRIAPDDGGPVSQMQKIALQRINADGSRHYLSAAGPVPGTPGVVVPPAPGSANQSGTHTLLFQSPRIREEVKDGMRVITDEVDDYLCWTIVGISKFQYTFFDAFGQNTSIPDMPITPFPTLFNTPVYHSHSKSLDMVVANFFYQDPRTKTYAALDAYIGNIGPLRVTIYQAAPHGGMGHDPMPAYVLDPRGPVPPDHASNGRSESHIALPQALHNLVVVQMPSLEAMVKAVQEDAVSGSQDDQGNNARRDIDMGSIHGRSLPLLFIRSYDGVGYHSGHSIVLEHMFMDVGGMRPDTDISSYLAAAHATSVEPGLHGLSLRVV